MLNKASHHKHNLCTRMFMLCVPPAILLLSGCAPTSDEAGGANPGVQEFPIAYVKRKIILDNMGNVEQPSITEPQASMPGGDLYIKSRSSLNAPEKNITQSITNGLGDVKDVNVSYDGKKLVFSLLEEDPTPNDDTDNPTWNIYIYDLELDQVERVIFSDIIADTGDDLSPAFLPDGRIVFSSSRMTKTRSILSDEQLGKTQISPLTEDGSNKALVLHVMDSNGNNIEQISFNQSHDLDPTVLSDGRILFSRWDRMRNNNAISLFTILPDGSKLEAYYGAHDESHVDSDGNTVQFMQPRQLPDGSILALAQPFTNTFGGAEPVIIDAENYIDLNQPTNPNADALLGPAMSKATTTNIVNTNQTSLEGRYSSVYPLNDNSNRLLVSKGLCRVNIQTGIAADNSPILETQACIEPYLSDPTVTPTYPAYGIWLYDGAAGTDKPIVLAESDTYITQAVAMQPSTRPEVNNGTDDSLLDNDLIAENVGILNIRSVYDMDGNFEGGSYGGVAPLASYSNILEQLGPTIATQEKRPARFIRIVKAVAIPDGANDDDLPNLANEAFARNARRTLGMREIIGYAPVQPDGSVRVKVPSDIAFYFEVLDKNAHRIGERHENWLQVTKGDTLECSGCHEHTSNVLPEPHGRASAQAPGSNTGAPSNGYFYPNTLDPATGNPYFANMGDTIAEVIVRAQAVNSNEALATPSVNVVYNDIWTDPGARVIDDAISFTYSGVDGLTTAMPTTKPECETDWHAYCRTIINYPTHIAPLWTVDRGVGTCTTCHTPLDPSDNTLAFEPKAQLDLDVGPSDQEPDHLKSYRELFFPDDEQEVANNALIDKTVQDVDANGAPIFDINNNPVLVNVTVSPSMNTGGARSSAFMHKMYETNLNTNTTGAGTALSFNVDHRGMLTNAELRLIAEWLDLGGQYYNNPFAPLAPQN